MSFEVSVDRKTGRFTFSYKSHVVVVAGGMFVAAGLGALVAPWWYPIAAAALGLGGLTLEPAVNWGVGCSLTVIGLGVLAYKYLWMDAQARRIAQDRALTAQRPPQPAGVTAYFAGLTAHDSYRSSADTLFREEYTRYAAPDHRLLDRKTAAAYDNFRTRAEQLHGFIGVNFSWFPQNQVGWADHRYCLAPDLNLDRGLPAPDAAKEAVYQALRDELDERVALTRTAYDIFLGRLRSLDHL